MDYVQEELARQRRILAVLMMGEQMESGGNDEASETSTREEELFAEDRTQRNNRLFRCTDERVVTEKTDLRGRSNNEKRHRGFTGTEQTEVVPEERRGLTGNVFREQTVTEVLWVEDGGTSGAGELSRTFERDARRYDGGFSLY